MYKQTDIQTDRQITNAASGSQRLWRIEYLNTGHAKSAICKQIGGRPCFYV